MSTHVTREEFERRMRVLEGEVEGEKLVTRHILEQTQRNGDDLGVLKTDVRRLSGETALIKGVVTHQSGLLNVLTQDVGLMRQEMNDIRRDIGGVHQEMNDIRRDIGGMHQEMNDVRRDVGGLRQEMQTSLNGVTQRMEELERNVVAAIRAALAPREPVGGTPA